MSGGFGVHIGGCAPKIIVVVLTVGVVIALVVGILLGSADISVRAGHGSVGMPRLRVLECGGDVRFDRGLVGSRVYW